MESLKGINVLVSGASVAGLSIAYWLVKYGFKVTIVERAPHIRPGGQALDVRGPGLEVAARMGILDDIRNHRTRLTGMSIVDSSGKETFRSTERTATGGRHDSPDIEILRDDLCRVLFQLVGNQVEYLFDNSIVSLNQDETGVDVIFANSVPQRFDLVVGADGLRSNVRRLVFGADEQFIRYLGYNLAVFFIPNFLGLDHWEIFFQDNDIFSGCVILEKSSEAITYLGFSAATPVDYDYRDIASQKRLVAERVANTGWEVPRIVEYMQDSPNFYFDSVNQIIMPNWSKGRVVLVGDAGYSVSPALGQGTTVAMVGAYTLAGELAAHKHDLQTGLNNYESELREYINSNQELANTSMGESEFAEQSGVESITHPDGPPDLGEMVIPFTLKNY